MPAAPSPAPADTLLEGVQDLPGRADDAFPGPLRQREAALRPEALDQGAVALSGGGIRSATVSLGVFQALARRGLLGRIGYLSTVSGGGYFGGFFGMLFCRGATNGLKNAEAVLSDEHSPEVSFLRENGRFLAPNGSGDLLLATATALRNWISVLIVVTLPILTLFVALDLLRAVVPILGSTPPAGRWWWSAWFLFPFLVLAVATIPLGWSYWLIARPSSPGIVLLTWMPPVLLSAGAFVAWSKGVTAPFPDPFYYLVAGVVTGLPVGWLIVAAVGGAPGGQWSNHLRYRLSKWLTTSLVVLGAGVVLTLMDTFGQSLYLTWSREGISGVGMALTAFGGTLAAVASGSRKLATVFSTDQKRFAMPKTALLYAAAASLAIALVTLLWALAHGLTWNWESPDRRDPMIGVLAWATVIGTVLTWCTAHVWTFVNRSSLYAFYESRIRRAYLGASNPKRKQSKKSLTDVDPDDGRPFREYRPEMGGGPIHLINVTINETVDARSQVQQQDRRGMAMAVGPAGVSVARRHHALWVDRPASGGPPADGRFYVFPSGMPIRPASLDVGEWLAISGAAFSTGMGARTNLGLSLLTGFFNVRLGYWWDSSVRPWMRADTRAPRSPGRQVEGLLATLFPVHSALADEWLARFHGVARRSWNLSDGGHFENLAAYELIRRRMRFIVVCDNGADPDYRFEDLSNLVRKARLDFDAEISFLNEAQLDAVLDPMVRRWFGTLDQLRRGSWTTEAVMDPRTEADRQVMDQVDQTRLSLAHAALARVEYRDGTGGKVEQVGSLLYIKPTLTGGEPIDVLQYHLEHPAFPHEPTADQFFDEAQWESYRRLGEHIANRLLLEVPDDAHGQRWNPLWALREPVRAAEHFARAIGRTPSTSVRSIPEGR